MEKIAELIADKFDRLAQRERKETLWLHACWTRRCTGRCRFCALWNVVPSSLARGAA